MALYLFFQILITNTFNTLTELRSAFGTAEDSYLTVLRQLIDRGEVPPYLD